MTRVQVARALAGVAWLAAVVLGLRGDLAGLDERLWDRSQGRLPAPTPAIEACLVAIDDDALEAQGGPPLDRRVYADALRALDDAGATAIVLDVFFEADKDPDGDRELASALTATEALIPYELGPRTRLLDGRIVTRVEQTGPAPALGVPPEAGGFANLPVHTARGGVYRHALLAQAGPEGETRPALGLALARQLGARDPVPVDQPVRMDFRPLRSDAGLPVVPLQAVLDRRPLAKAMVQGRVCFVGATAARMGDVKDTPLGPRPGALVHAVVAENVLGQRLVRELPGFLGVLLALPVALALAAPPPAWPVLAILTGLLGLGTTLLAAGLGYFLGGGTAMVAALSLGVVGLGERLVPRREPVVEAPDPARVAAELQQDLDRGDLRGARLRYRELPPEIRQLPELRARYALSLLDTGRDGLVAKALAGHAEWDLPADLRECLAEGLVAEGFLELALAQLEELYRRDPARAGVGDRLFALRTQRDERWGVVSPRAARELLGRDFAGVEPLAAGGEGLVLAAADREDRARVVIKLLHPRRLEEPSALASFRHEAAALEAMAGQGTPRLRKVDKGRLPFLVLERAPGAPPEGSLPPEERRRVLREVAATLARLHATGWSHGDLHPGNLLVAPDRVTLVDLGQATRLGEPSGGGGTPGFVAPEQAEGAPAEPSRDVFGLGSTARALGAQDAVWERCQAPEAAARPSLEEVLAALA
jgi:CHASE2 domain-containing sensor protein